LQTARRVSHVRPHAQHLPEAVAMSSDHTSWGSLTTSATRLSEIVLYSQGATLDIPPQTAP